MNSRSNLGTQFAKVIVMVCLHMVARCLRVRLPLSSPPVAPTLWRALRRAFPKALACVVMPDHFHVIAFEPSAPTARRKLGAVLSGIRRSEGCDALVWERAPPPQLVPDTAHLRRQIRYVALNPSRAGLVRDPLEWLWSTHRDVVGAIIDPWVQSDDLAKVLRVPAEGFNTRHHLYVSGDPSVNVRGTAFPIPASPASVAAIPLETILMAARAAMRATARDARRRSPARSLFMDLARASGWTDARAVSRATGAATATVRARALLHRPIPSAAWLCLGDRRLRGTDGPTDRRPARVTHPDELFEQYADADPTR